MTGLPVGQRVRVVEVLATWDAKHHRLGTTGTITRMPNPASPFYSRQHFYVVRHDDGAEWSYGRRQIEPID